MAYTRRLYFYALMALTLTLTFGIVHAQVSAFPVTIEHKFGSTTITETPERVIAIGFNDQDPLLALGVQPLAVRYWYGDETNAIFTWAQDRVSGDVPAVLNMPFGNLNYEAILAFNPDLIVSVYSGITQEEYDTLSQIAPTIAQSGAYIDFGMPWQEATRLIGAAIGQSEQAETLVNQVEASLEQARQQNPQFAGKSVAVVYSYGAGAYGYYTAQDPRGRFFTDLGFVVPDELIEIAGESYYADISTERIDLLDQDLLVFVGMQFVEGGRATVESDPLISQLDAVREGRVIFVPDAYDDALQFSTVLSLEYVLEGILPEVQAAVGSGEPTQTTDCESGTRSFEHAMGVSCIPENPERVVVLDTGELDNALALGAPVVGAPVADALQYQAYLSDQLDGISDTGSISEPNFEAILALEPDLIIGSKQRYEAIYPQLSAIAPTVFTESLRVPWQDNFRFHADALGRTAEAEQLLADYEAHIAELQAALGDALDSTTISIIRFRPGQVRLYLKSSYIGYILQDVGLQRRPSQDEDVFSAEISIEEMQQVDADYIFVTGYDVEDSERETFLNSPLWQTLGAVQNGHVIDVNDDTWIAGLGVQAANLVLDDLETLLAPAEVAQCEDGFRLFDHEYLLTDPLCIPESPERVVALDMTMVELMLIADVPPVASSGLVFSVYAQMHPELEATYTHLIETSVDMGYPPNIEAILESNPDLIIAPSDLITTDIYAELNAVAPTILYEPIPGDWRSRLTFAGEILGLSETVDALLADYDARVSEFQEQLGAGAAEIEVSLVRTLPDQIGLVLTGTSAAAVVESVGLSRPEAQAVDYDYVLQTLGGRPELLISMEELQLADGDVILIFGDSSMLLQDPLWNSLSAVRNGQAYEVGYYWWGDSLLSAHDMLDDLFQYVAQVEPEHPNPFEDGIEISGEATN